MTWLNIISFCDETGAYPCLIKFPLSMRARAPAEFSERSSLEKLFSNISFKVYVTKEEVHKMTKYVIGVHDNPLFLWSKKL